MVISLSLEMTSSHFKVVGATSMIAKKMGEKSGKDEDYFKNLNKCYDINSYESEYKQGLFVRYRVTHKG